MANVATYLEQILSAVYGEEVRGSIHDAIQAMNVESSSAMEYAKTAKDSAANSAASAQASASTATQKASEASASASAAKASEASVAANASAAKASEAAAKASETAAKASETAAKTSETNAASSASAAKASEAAAKASETAAKTSETNAASSASAAKASEAAAKTSETSAASSAKAAKTSEDAAKASQTAAKASETSAAKDATDAKSAKEAAETAKNAAETARNNAAGSASSAAASALSAQQYSGKPPKPDPTTKTWWIWDAELGKYVDSHIGSEIEGPQGVGISDIKLTSGNHMPGTSDIYTVTLTDGKSYNISVYNGRDGDGIGDVLGRSFDLVLPTKGWSGGQITIANTRLIALSSYKYFISPDEASSEKFIDCNVQPQDITTTGFITFKSDSNPGVDLTVEVIRFELSANDMP